MEGAGMSQPIIIPINYIERKPNSNQYRVVGKGVTVEFLSRLINDPEWSVERICANYGLTPAEVFAAWAFYYDHKDEIDNRVQASADRFDSNAAQDREKRARVTKRLKTSR
jgi:uncharacterized protein (DUF433 family)